MEEEFARRSRESRLARPLLGGRRMPLGGRPEQCFFSLKAPTTSPGDGGRKSSQATIEAAKTAYFQDFQPLSSGAAALNGRLYPDVMSLSGGENAFPGLRRVWKAG